MYRHGFCQSSRRGMVNKDREGSSTETKDKEDGVVWHTGNRGHGLPGELPPSDSEGEEEGDEDESEEEESYTGEILEIGKPPVVEEHSESEYESDYDLDAPPVMI